MGAVSLDTSKEVIPVYSFSCLYIPFLRDYNWYRFRGQVNFVPRELRHTSIFERSNLSNKYQKRQLERCYGECFEIENERFNPKSKFDSYESLKANSRIYASQPTKQPAD